MTFFVAAAKCGITIVPMPQKTSSAILRAFTLVISTGSETLYFSKTTNEMR